jgi:hypothetical protein
VLTGSSSTSAGARGPVGSAVTAGPVAVLVGDAALALALLVGDAVGV